MTYARSLTQLPSNQYENHHCWENVLVISAESAQPVTYFSIYEDNIRSILRRQPRGMGVMVIVRHDQPPTPGYSEHAQRLLNSYRVQLLAVAVVIQSTGFAAAAQRGVATTILTASGMNRRISLHRSVPQAVPWLIERLQPQEYRADARQCFKTALTALSTETSAAGQPSSP